MPIAMPATALNSPSVRTISAGSPTKFLSWKISDGTPRNPSLCGLRQYARPSRSRYGMMIFEDSFPLMRFVSLNSIGFIRALLWS